MSVRSKKRRHARRHRRRETFALIARTGVAYVSPDVYERLRERAGQADAQPLMPGIELVVVERFKPGTIAGFDVERLRPIGPMPIPNEFPAIWGRR